MRERLFKLCFGTYFVRPDGTIFSSGALNATIVAVDEIEAELEARIHFQTQFNEEGKGQQLFASVEIKEVHNFIWIPPKPLKKEVLFEKNINMMWQKMWDLSL